MLNKQSGKGTSEQGLRSRDSGAGTSEQGIVEKGRIQKIL
ncbi:hypothetical protein LYNGBM3L_36890 [Moorena producens 3L]|uniref:Uncharacterized protein n=1 Tax=Moorena producens 3L TaxID=489825 RepID=F4XQ02_9CYAN|nr:hypothetical protein LYNGBM3L_36890 [Moorena producens 3L]